MMDHLKAIGLLAATGLAIASIWLILDFLVEATRGME